MNKSLQYPDTPANLSNLLMQIKKIAATKMTAIILSKARMRDYCFRFNTALLIINPSECTRKMYIPVGNKFTEDKFN